MTGNLRESRPGSETLQKLTPEKSFLRRDLSEAGTPVVTARMTGNLRESQPGSDKEVADLSGRMTSQGRGAPAQIPPVRMKDAPGNAAPAAHLVVTPRMRRAEKITKVAKGVKSLLKNDPSQVQVMMTVKELERAPSQSLALKIPPVILIRVLWLDFRGKLVLGV